MIVIVGAGHAGAETAAALRQNRYHGRIVLVGDEPHLPYQRPPLTKGVLSGDVEPGELAIRGPETYARSGVELELGTAVTRIDRDQRRVDLADGRSLPYDQLVLATGGRPRPLPVGADVAVTLHTLDEATALRARLYPGCRVLIVGGGFIGLEVAASCIRAGAAVTVVEAAPRTLQRVCPPVVSTFMERVHRDRGVDLRTGTTVVAMKRSGNEVVVDLDDGDVVGADLVVGGIGIVANDELAARAGLAVDNGIVVDAACRTSDPDVVAVGDCTRQEHGFLRRQVRLESVQNASDQARIATRTLLGAPPAPPVAPWIWSDQYEHKIQMIGVPGPGAESIVLRDPDTEGFTVLHVQDGVVVGLTAVDRPRDFAGGRRLVAERVGVDRTALAAASSVHDLLPRRPRPERKS